MNRIIKFRAWTANHWINKGMVYDYHVTTYLESCGWDSFPVMQYTGLNDAEGNKIYEGDYLKTDGGILEVCHIDGRFIAIWPDTGEHAYELYQAAPELSICGNKFEDPELLNGN